MCHPYTFVFSKKCSFLCLYASKEQLSTGQSSKFKSMNTSDTLIDILADKQLVKTKNKTVGQRNRGTFVGHLFQIEFISTNVSWRLK